MSRRTYPGYVADDKDSIERHAKTLEGKSLQDLYPDESAGPQAGGKGGLGAMVEAIHFGYKPNSLARPDFPDAGVELKTSPLRQLKSGRLSVKERLVLSIINFEDAAKEQEFKKGAFWKKNQLLLLMFYLWKVKVPAAQLRFDLAGLWTYPPEDLEIIVDDWHCIIDKIKRGKAEELSERDTLFLAACTKGKDSSELRSQASGEPAKQRAYSLKRSYMDGVYARLKSRRIDLPAAQRIADVLGRRADETFEAAVVRRMSAFRGMKEGAIKSRLKLTYSQSAKNKLNLLARGMLGAPGKQIEEFLKAGVQMKTVRLNMDGSLTEHMSFRQINYDKVVGQSWLRSTFHDELNKRLFFVVFQKDRDGECRFVGSFFFGMPALDFDEASKVWSLTKQVLVDKKPPYVFPSAQDNRVAHVRPKARNASDTYMTSWGHEIRKMAFWLNRDYILDVVRRHIGS